jgi:hypothetical protein
MALVDRSRFGDIDRLLHGDEEEPMTMIRCARTHPSASADAR